MITVTMECANDPERGTYTFRESFDSHSSALYYLAGYIGEVEITIYSMDIEES